RGAGPVHGSVRPGRSTRADRTRRRRERDPHSRCSPPRIPQPRAGRPRRRRRMECYGHRHPPVTIPDRAIRLRRLAVGAQVPVLAIVIAALSWPFLAGPVRAGLVRSWEIGLQLAAMHAFRHGVDIAWTYGQLGFLVIPQP